MAQILEKALDLALERKDPRKKLERRKKKEASRSRPRPDEVSSKNERKNESEPSPRRSRYIPSSLRERLLERASYQCEYRGLAGVRCTERTGLEIDHIEPYAKEGATGETNLRVLCRGHNLFLAVEEFGEEFVARKVERKRQQTSGTSPAGRCEVTDAR